MAPQERSLSQVVLSVIGNVQDIVRSEVHLAKTEIREEAVKLKSSAVMFAAGLITSLYALLFLLFAAGAGLVMFMPLWAAALTIGLLLALLASVLWKIGVERFNKVHGSLERTAETIKENIEWAKQKAK